ncbi:MAG TPA: hypothetical protein VK859_15960, partial [bacterium]|nr:hypothetical protein [bacterium]
MPDYKPFSIYDDDGEKDKSVPIPSEMMGADGDLNLEIEDVPSQEDEKTRQNLMQQLGVDASSSGGTAPAPKSSAALEETPFLQGQSSESVEDRAKALIRKRQETGKIRDRRKVASIFDKPIEPDKAIKQGRTAWHPLSHRAQAFWFLFPALVFFG